jgi:hypothetical protein
MLKSITWHIDACATYWWARGDWVCMERRSGKRTTVIFEEKDRQYLEQLIREGKEPGIKPFISKMFDVYRSMAMYDWKFPGEYYVGISRVAFFSQENLQLLIELIPEDDLRATGRKLGETTAISIEASQNVDPKKKENWGKVLERLRVFGYGDILLREDYVVAKNPFISNLAFLTGFLEGVLGTTLEARITTSPIVFEVG